MKTSNRNALIAVIVIFAVGYALGLITIGFVWAAST
jgi:hypothetical protein